MSEEQQEAIKVERDVDPFTRMMFGGPPRREHVEVNTTENSPEKANGDYYALMEQVDSIMDSVNKLKPMLKEFSPLLDYFKK
ncbi:hypothetical protein M3936_04690 [Sutcliffiella horikoshii]|uniref:hypothetical protein n=1 Tax=Sutcliffiella horikoshii TaxID=79883 RepID=UPI00203DCB46|nr:hypothetical protein [Sutcliffiella horikoshii]MCM3616877.1 hypothetical protein [Sutcliffiella horikoshii]